jgi:4-amino-4-deoxy-L-arabinose transferase-like glycosyltransferase
VVFIGLSPILLGISLIVNTDAILWILTPFALLSFLIYQKESSKKFLYLSGFILGMAILNKFVANLLFPFFLVLIFLKYILSDYSKEEAAAYFKKSMRDYLLLILITLLTIFIFYPSAWVKPKSILSVTIFSMAFEEIWPFFVGALALILADVFWLKSFFIEKICAPFKSFKPVFTKAVSLGALSMIAFVFLNVLQKMKYYDFEGIFFWPKSDVPFLQEFMATFFSAFFPLAYGIPPLVSLFFVLAIIFIISTRQVEKKQNLIGAFALLLFILVFYLANSFAQISSTVRYQIVIYPIASIIAAIGLSEFINLERIRKYFSGIKFYILLALLVFASVFSLKSIDPFFLSYSSELLPKKYIINPRDMADGSWEASEFLNNLPHAENLVVWSDKKQVCEKFIGRCSTDPKKNITYDYFVTSRSSKDEFIKKTKVQGAYKIGTAEVDVPRLYAEEDPGDFKIIIGGRSKNYVKITSAESAK